MVNTRFRPTPYQDLHPGSAWCWYWNWYTARRSGGKVTLILDDVTYTLSAIEFYGDGLSLAEGRENYVRDLTWLGMPPDDVRNSSEFHARHLENARKLGVGIPLPIHGKIGQPAIVSMDGKSPIYEFHPFHTVIAVTDDIELGVTGFTRGTDLLPEAALYHWFTQVLGHGPIYQHYCSVVRPTGTFHKYSKSMNPSPPSIFQLRQAGYLPEEIMNTLLELEEQRKEQFRDALVVGVLDIGSGLINVEKPRREFFKRLTDAQQRGIDPLPESMRWH